MIVKLDWRAIQSDPQHVVLLERVADDIVEEIPRYTRVDTQPARSEVTEGAGGVPEVIIGSEHAAAVSVEFGTRYRRASAPIRRAAMALGLKVPN